jgi:predicted PurR-regulated permease PerM
MAFARRISPLSSQHLDALVQEFITVGRAVLVSVALTALVEGGVAGIAYFALGLPSAALLTVLTAIAALVPIGTILVWGPLALMLWSQGRTFAATVIVLTGAVVISGIDHLARPYLARVARTRLHPLLVFVGMFGGMASLGGWGLFAGPLVVALGMAALRLWDREQRARALATTGLTPMITPVLIARSDDPAVSAERTISPGE